MIPLAFGMVLLFAVALAFALADSPGASAQSAEDECNEDDPAAVCPTATPKPTRTPSPPTATRTPTPKPEPTPTCEDPMEPYNKDEGAEPEGFCTPTPKPTRTNTPVPPTPTDTPVPPTPTDTPVPPTPTDTPIPPTPTDTPIPEPTDTPAAPTPTDTPTPDPRCAIKSLGTISKQKSRSGSWIAECSSTNREDRYAHFYSFEVSQTSNVQIDLVSSVDPYMFLLDGTEKNGKVLAQDNNGGQGNNSQITKLLSAKSYTVEATTNAVGKVGSFTLTINVSTPIPTPAPPTPTYTPTPTRTPTPTPVSTPTPVFNFDVQVRVRVKGDTRPISPDFDNSIEWNVMVPGEVTVRLKSRIPNRNQYQYAIGGNQSTGFQFGRSECVWPPQAWPTPTNSGWVEITDSIEIVRCAIGDGRSDLDMWIRYKPDSSYERRTVVKDVKKAWHRT